MISFVGQTEHDDSLPEFLDFTLLKGPFFGAVIFWPTQEMRKHERSTATCYHQETTLCWFGFCLYLFGKVARVLLLSFLP